MPKRIQRRRIKGWRMPKGAVYVGRGTKYGNPWRVGGSFGCSAEKACFLYEELLKAREYGFQRTGKKHEGLPYYDDIKKYLRGKDLACWCSEDNPFFHADTLMRIANEGT